MLSVTAMDVCAAEMAEVSVVPASARSHWTIWVGW